MSYRQPAWLWPWWPRAQTADAAAVGSTTKLPPAAVRAQQDRTSTESTERYNSTQATVGKAAAYLKEIPQSISVVTQQRMEDQNMRNVEGAGADGRLCLRAL